VYDAQHHLVEEIEIDSTRHQILNFGP